MDEAKTKVVRSKSSNSATNTKSNKEKNRKSRSNAEYQPRIVKKRGVYVEKANKINAQGVNIPKKQQIKAPPRPRPGKKPFLASVLTILSKSTTGTQLPEIEVNENPTQNLDKVKLRAKRLKYINDNKIHAIATINECKNQDTTKKTKPKYKSKILNDLKKEQQQCVVLQTNMEIIQTPSIFSEKSSKDDTFKFSDLPRLVKNEDLTTRELVKEINSSIAKEVLEGKIKKCKKVTLVDNDPMTLVSEESKKDDKRLYNFFVDLLETSFSLHNVKAAQSLADINQSKTALEINESVAKKLNISNKKTPEMFEHLTHKPSKRFYSIKNEEEVLSDHRLLDYFTSKPSSSKWSRQELSLKSPVKYKRRLVSYSKKFEEPAKTLKSVANEKKSIYKNNNKQNLLNILKEQLRMDDEIYEEPQNLYQALKQIAHNKRKCTKSINFDYTAKKPKEGLDDPECIFKRRKVISPSTKWSRKYKPERELLWSLRPIPRKSDSEYSKRKYAKSVYAPDAGSYHSLEVTGYDYEIPSPRSRSRNKNKQIVYTYDSSNTTITQHFSPYDAILRYTPSGLSSD